MGKSIIQYDKTFCFCQDETCGGILEEHHCVYGRGRKKISDKEGLVVYLCSIHHRGTNGVHGKNGAELSLKLKKIAQEAWESKYIEEYPYKNHAKEAAREAWIRMMDMNYLDDYAEGEAE